MFFLMVVLWWRVINKSGSGLSINKLALLTGISCLLYGIAMEFVQEYLVINRSFDTVDIIADALGCAAGVIYCRRVNKKN